MMAKVKNKTGKALTAHKSKLPANWREELAKDAREESENVPTGAGNKLTLKKSGQFSYQGADLGDSFECVVLNHVVAKQWFEGEYDEDNPGPPSCFALKANMKNIAPHANSPNKQSDVCDGCPHNEWG